MPEPTAQVSDSLALIRQAKGGDPEATEALFKRYGARVLQIARARLGPVLRAKLESQDIAQEALIRAFKGFDHFDVRHEGAFLHWLAEIVKNVIRDQHDRFKARKRAASLDEPLIRREENDERDTPEPPGPDKTPSQYLTITEDFERVLAALDKLPEESREAVVQRDMEGLSFAEVGQALGRSTDAARMLYSRAKARLSELLEDR